MNKVVLMGRLTKDPEVRYSQGEQPVAIARYTLAVDRRFVKRDDPNAQTADFISCKAFGRQGEFAEKYLKKGTKICVSGRIETGSYVNKDGVKVYTTDVVVDDQEFAESKNAQGGGQGGYSGGGYQGGGGSYQGGGAPANNSYQQQEAPADGFMNIPDGIEEELPFS